MQYNIAPKPKPNPNGSSLCFFLFNAYKHKVMLDPTNKIGPMDDAPKVEPIPPRNKKSPEPIPSIFRIILCNKLMLKSNPYPKTNPRMASIGIAKKLCHMFIVNPNITNNKLRGWESKSDS